jgi:hypothetical protein
MLACNFGLEVGPEFRNKLPQTLQDSFMTIDLWISVGLLGFEARFYFIALAEYPLVNIFGTLLYKPLGVVFLVKKRVNRVSKG